MNVPNNNRQLNGYPGTQSPQGATPYQGRAQQSATAGQPAVPGVSAQPVQPVPQWAPGVPAQPAYQGVPQAGVPARPAAPAQPVPQGYSTAPQGYSTAPQGYSTAPQGFAPGYAPVPQGPVKVRVNCVSLVFGIGVWAFIALLVLSAWVEMHSPDASASENDIFGFYPLFVVGLGGPFNLIGFIVASSRAREKPAKWKLNRLGIILNASPYLILFVFVIIAYVAMAVGQIFS